ncbi:universal stress protein [Dactylosporangium sp. NPDC005572]|uniref:universal stress protein n=1 Tax=Dactylosporangium sp. NPDC005572 TaxID=3156889 RepID=UPI0033BC21D6
MRRIVVGVSQSLAGLAAIRYGLGEARRIGAPLYAVRAFAFPAHWRGPAVTEWQRELRAEAQRYVVDAFASAAGGAPDDVEVLVAAPVGRADHVLLDLAGDDDLLVLGAAGRSWVVRACTRAARCPVVVVPQPELARRRPYRMLRRELSKH